MLQKRNCGRQKEGALCYQWAIKGGFLGERVREEKKRCVFSAPPSFTAGV